MRGIDCTTSVEIGLLSLKSPLFLNLHSILNLNGHDCSSSYTDKLQRLVQSEIRWNLCILFVQSVRYKREALASVLRGGLVVGGILPRLAHPSAAAEVFRASPCPPKTGT